MTRKLIAFIVLPVIILGIIAAGCDIKSPTEGLPIIVKTIARQTTVSVNITDASGAIITAPLVAKFTGRDADKVIDEVNLAITQQSTTSGSLLFCIKDNVQISSSSPVTLLLKISSANNDYLAVSYPVTITSTGYSQISVKMVPMTQLQSKGIDNVVKAGAGTASASGAVTSPVSITTNSGSVVTIPAGSVLKDASGSPLSGSLTVNTTIYSAGASSLIPVSRTMPDNSMFYPLAAASVQVTDASGRSASQSSGTPASVFVPAGNAVNPLTGAPYQAGDKAEVYTADAQGNLTKVADVTASSGSPSMSAGRGGVFTDGTAAGLGFPSPLSLNQQSFLGNFVRPAAPPHGTWNFTTSGFTSAYQGTFKFYVVQNGQLTALSQTSNSYLNFRTTGLPAGVDTVAICYGNTKLELAPRAVIAADAKNGTTTFDLSSINLTTYTVFIQGKCPSESPSNPKRISPTITVHMAKGGMYMGDLNIEDGYGVVMLPKGLYTMSATYKGTTYSVNVTVDGSSVDIGTSSNVEKMKFLTQSGDTVLIGYYIITTEACN
ncbi:MAG: hypothetical protein ACM3Q2_13235 [Syntrophothermus sp.]